MKKTLLSLILFLTFSAGAATSFDYEITPAPGTENIRPLAFYDDGKATYIKVKPVEVRRLPDGRSEPILPMVFIIGPDGHATATPQKWDAKTGIITVPVISEKWLIRSDSKAIQVRKTTGTHSN